MDCRIHTSALKLPLRFDVRPECLSAVTLNVFRVHQEPRCAACGLVDAETSPADGGERECEPGSV